MVFLIISNNYLIGENKMLILFNYLKLDNRILNNKVLKSIKFIDNNSGIYYIRKWLNSERSMEC